MEACVAVLGVGQKIRTMQKRVRQWRRKAFRPKVVRINGLKIRIPEVASEQIVTSIYEGNYESGELHVLTTRLEATDVLMEVGAGMGLLSAHAAKEIGDDRVFAFEANPALEGAIRENYELNRVNPRLTMALVGESAGTRPFYVREHFWGSSIFEKEGASAVEVPVVSFNEAVERIDPTFLVIDIEGGEYQLVQYANFHNIRKLLIELHDWKLSPEQLDFVYEKLQESGFHLVDAVGGGVFFFERAVSF
jgi:FkbM family methyltransferase